MQLKHFAGRLLCLTASGSVANRKPQYHLGARTVPEAAGRAKVRGFLPYEFNFIVQALQLEPGGPLPANCPMFPLSGGDCRLLGYNIVISMDYG